MVRLFIDSIPYEDALNWREFSIRLQLDKTINAVITTYDIDLIAGGQLFRVLNDIRINGNYCRAIDFKLQYSCNNGQQYIDLVSGNLFITECKFNLTKCEVSTKAFDKTFSSYINTNKNVPFITNAVFTKDGDVMVPLINSTVQVFTPSTGVTFGSTRPGYKVFNLFKKIVEFISNGNVEFGSFFFQTDLIGSNHFLTSGLGLRSGIITPFTVTFADLFEFFRSKYNLGMGFVFSNGKPTLIIEKQEFFQQSAASTTIIEVQPVEVSYDVPSLFNRIALGNKSTLNQFESNKDGQFLQFPQAPFRGFLEESFLVVGECNIDSAYDAYNETEIIVCPNIIEDVFIHKNDRYDLNPFVIQTIDIATVPKSAKTDPYQINQTVYNGGLINAISSLNGIGGVPNSYMIANDGYPSIDLFFFAELNSPPTFLIPCSIGLTITAFRLLMPLAVGLIEFENIAYYSEQNGFNVPFGDVIFSSPNYFPSGFGFKAPNVCNMGFRVRLRLIKDPCAGLDQVLTLQIALNVYDELGQVLLFRALAPPIVFSPIGAPQNFQIQHSFDFIPLNTGYFVAVDLAVQKELEEDAAIYFQETDLSLGFFSDFTPYEYYAIQPSNLPIFDPNSRKTLAYTFEQPISFEQVKAILFSPFKKINFTYGFLHLQQKAGFIDTIQINNLDSFDTEFKLLNNE